MSFFCLSSFSSASLSVPLADPPGASVLVAAVAWLQGTLLGTVATTLAIVAIASVGLMMLAGRLAIRRGLAVVAGCFILFGASSIVAGLQSALAGAELAAAPNPPPPAPALPAPPPPPGGRDPYAGASVPPR